MAIKVQCPKCKAVHEVPDDRAGQVGRCNCGERVIVPNLPDDATRKVTSQPTAVPVSCDKVPLPPKRKVTDPRLRNSTVFAARLSILTTTALVAIALTATVFGWAVPTGRLTLPIAIILGLCLLLWISLLSRRAWAWWALVVFFSLYLLGLVFVSIPLLRGGRGIFLALPAILPAAVLLGLLLIDPPFRWVRAQRTGSRLWDALSGWSAASLASIVLLTLIVGPLFLVNRNSGRFPLHRAANVGDVALICRLVRQGADVNARDSDGSTPLDLAASQGATDAAEALLAAGADINSVNPQTGRTALHEACSGQYSTWDYGPTTELLIRWGADMNARDHKANTPLHLAINSKNEPAASVLRKHGAHE